MFALMIVFCFRKSETLRILLSNLNLSASIQVEPRNRFVLSSLAFAGPISVSYTHLTLPTILRV